MTRAAQLIQKRQQLLLQSALQRQQLSFLNADIEARLATADRVVDVVTAVARNPAVAVGVVAGAMILGPWRIMKWVSRGALLFGVVNKLRALTRM